MASPAASSWSPRNVLPTNISFITKKLLNSNMWKHAQKPNYVRTMDVTQWNFGNVIAIRKVKIGRPYTSRVMPWTNLVLNIKRSGWLMLVLAQRYNEHPPILKHKSFLQVSFLAFHTSKAWDILQCTFKHFAKSVAQKIQFWSKNRSFTVLNKDRVHISKQRETL